MHGDVIRRLGQNRDVLGHVHTAGNPRRGGLDDNQEIHSGPVMRKRVGLKYAGCVGQEFNARGPLLGLE
jgi:hydroxypyruvate isomerase